MNDLFLKLAVKLQTLAKCEEGQDLVEYALLVGLISVACVGAIKPIAASISAIFTSIIGSLDGATAPAS